MDENRGNIIIYRDADNSVQLDVRMEQETVWLTQRQIADGASTSYEYDYTRLAEVHFPQHAQLDIRYEYDSVGHIAKRTDITGQEQFRYDMWGNISVSDKLMVVPTEKTGYRFITKFRYDALGRIRDIIYPDGEIVNYYYGNSFVNKITRNDLQGYIDDYYIRHLYYDANNHPTELLTGNWYSTTYTYDSNRLWLTDMITSRSNRTLQDLHYNHDAVGNITSITQTADSVRSLGGAYTQSYQYDSLYRLTKADMTSDYMGAYNNYTMTYSPSGLMGAVSCNDIAKHVWHGFCRTNNGTLTTHQLRSIYDTNRDETAFLQWDADGQLQTVSRPCTGDMRHHWWNESGQLSAMVDNTRCGYYGYDGEGNRAYKLTGYSWTDSYNAGTPNYRMYLSDAVLYVNPYMVVTPRGFTKHYYNGSQRIAAQIGHLSELPNSVIDSSAVALERLANARSYMTSVLNNSVTLLIDTVSKFVTIDGNLLSELQWQCVDDNEFTLTTTIHCDSNMLYPVLSKAPALLSQQTSGIYFYHPDHLGSATWVTDVGCDPVEYVHYMPYGELWRDQRSSTYSERFKFTGKERDSETGYDYFGARYYSSTLPLWLSVDPLAGEYPNLSPYAYCANNPIKNIDPDGNWSVCVHAYTDRSLSSYALYQVKNRHGDIIYQTIVRVKGYKNVQYRDRTIAYGDTPTGLYRMNVWRKSSDSRFGKYAFIDQTYLSGEGKGKNTNRDRMHTHGGGDIVDENGQLMDLKNTGGCIRMADEDINEMKHIVDALERYDSQEKMLNLIVSDDIDSPIINFINSRDKTKEQNSGIWLPEIIVIPEY